MKNTNRHLDPFARKLEQTTSLRRIAKIRAAMTKRSIRESEHEERHSKKGRSSIVAIDAVPEGNEASS